MNNLEKRYWCGSIFNCETTQLFPVIYDNKTKRTLIIPIESENQEEANEINRITLIGLILKQLEYQTKQTNT